MRTPHDFKSPSARNTSSRSSACVSARRESTGTIAGASEDVSSDEMCAYAGICVASQSPFSEPKRTRSAVALAMTEPSGGTAIGPSIVMRLLSSEPKPVAGRAGAASMVVSTACPGCDTHGAVTQPCAPAFVDLRRCLPIFFSATCDASPTKRGVVRESSLASADTDGSGSSYPPFGRDERAPPRSTVESTSSVAPPNPASGSSRRCAISRLAIDVSFACPEETCENSRARPRTRCASNLTHVPPRHVTRRAPNQLPPPKRVRGRAPTSSSLAAGCV